MLHDIDDRNSTIIYLTILAAVLAGVVAMKPDPASAESSDDESVTYWKLLGENVNELPGCDGEWTNREIGGGTVIRACASFAGPGDWDGSPASAMGAPNDEVVMVKAMQKFRDRELVKNRAVSLARHFKNLEACKAIGRSSENVIERWECSRGDGDDTHVVKLSYTGDDYRTLSLAYYHPAQVMEAQEAASSSNNKGL